MRFPVLRMLAPLACLACGTIAMGAYAQQEGSQDEVVVTGQRDARRVQGGEWNVTLSRAYRSGHLDAERPMGKERSWKFCRGDADVEPLMRILVGEGRTASSSTTKCSRLVVQLGDGKLRGSQSCQGGSMELIPVEAHRGVGSLAQRSGTGAAAPSGGNMVPVKNTLSVTGRYGRQALAIDFQTVQEPVVPDISYLARPDVVRWSIKGKRIGDCRPKPSLEN
ncbi:hypothetical protein AB2M62_10960 [Sphingomonas sp. MMS12-HWE2-04]|uniref:hypothetical protein n=1 Tax=Sphingomonas sp. MMS12-HWE2-04 TaxID=3234199 RepID=UPI0038509B02